MELLKEFLDFFLHLDKHLSEIIGNYGALTYFILFMIIFVETGVVVMPFLPGDSLLFAAGAFAASQVNAAGETVPGPLNLYYLIGLLFVAAFLGDTLNYIIGKYIGPKVFRRDYRFLKREHLLKTQAFYDRHGGKTIIFARFIPIIRTFAPFVAGVGTMRYGKFIVYNLVGGLAWVAIFLVAGYLFGNIPAVKRNFTMVIFGIIIVSLLPPTFEYVKALRAKRIQKKASRHHTHLS